VEEQEQASPSARSPEVLRGPGAVRRACVGQQDRLPSVTHCRVGGSGDLLGDLLGATLGSGPPWSCFRGPMLIPAKGVRQRLPCPSRLLAKGSADGSCPLEDVGQRIGCRPSGPMKPDATFGRRGERSLISGEEWQHQGDREPPFGATEGGNGAHCVHRAYARRRRFDPWDSDGSSVPGLANGETDACSEAGSEGTSMRRFFMGCS
jgi:hypothetical protein